MDCTQAIIKRHRVIATKQSWQSQGAAAAYRNRHKNSKWNGTGFVWVRELFRMDARWLRTVSVRAVRYQQKRVEFEKSFNNFGSKLAKFTQSVNDVKTKVKNVYEKELKTILSFVFNEPHDFPWMLESFFHSQARIVRNCYWSKNRFHS